MSTILSQVGIIMPILQMQKLRLGNCSRSRYENVEQHEMKPSSFCVTNNTGIPGSLPISSNGKFFTTEKNYMDKQGMIIHPRFTDVITEAVGG